MSAQQVALALSALLLGAVPAFAQDHSMHEHAAHSVDSPADGRVSVDFPGPMRNHFLGKMRNHLTAVSDAMGALAAGEYERAALIADEHLGMQSPGAQACTTNEQPARSSPASMDMEQMMSQFMPPAMRTAGLAMHQAASQFSSEARAAAQSHDAGKAVAALSKVTQQCVACHASFRVQR